MSWDAWLEDGKGAFPFGRPIRWMVALLDGAVVPFTIHELVAGGRGAGRSCRAATSTFGHRFLPRGAAGGPLRVTGFADLEAQLRKAYVILRARRAARDDRACASRRPARSRTTTVSWPSGRTSWSTPPSWWARCRRSSARCPARCSRRSSSTTRSTSRCVEGTTVTRFAALTNTDGQAGGRDRPQHGAGGGGAPARRVVLLERRPEAVARGPGRRPGRRDVPPGARDLPGQGRPPGRPRCEGCDRAALGGARPRGRGRTRLASARPTSRPRWFASSRSCKGSWAGSTSRRKETSAPEVADGGALALPPALRRGFRGRRRAARRQRPLRSSRRCRWPTSSTPWPATSASACMPTGSSDPFGLRRAGQGVIRVLLDFWPAGKAPGLEAIDRPRDPGSRRPAQGARRQGRRPGSQAFLLERLEYVLEARGYAAEEVKAAVHTPRGRCSRRRRRTASLASRPCTAGEPQAREDFEHLAAAFKRAKNILTKDAAPPRSSRGSSSTTPSASCTRPWRGLAARDGGYDARLQSLAACGSR